MIQIDTIGGIPIYRDEDTQEVFFTAALEIDADGSPHAYAPHNSGLSALDYLANAGSSGNWYGIATDKDGVPYIQTTDMPAPGYYVSTTALQNPDYPAGDPRRYVNSEVIPFIVLPPQAISKWRIKLGAPCTIENRNDGNIIGAIFADIGPRTKVGEASIAAAKALGVNYDAKHGGSDEQVFEYRIS